MKFFHSQSRSAVSVALLCLLAMGLTILAACMKDGLPPLSESFITTTETTTVSTSTPSYEEDKEVLSEDCLPTDSVEETDFFITDSTEEPDSTPTPPTQPTAKPSVQAPESPNEILEETEPSCTASPPSAPATLVPEAESSPEETEPISEETEPPTSNASVSEEEKQVIAQINAIRREHGLRELKLNEKLCEVAREKSRDMRKKEYFDHISPTYGSPFDMMKAFGISYRVAGENIAMGYPTPEEVVEGWMNSDGHRANILNASFTEIGVGYIAEGHYWTQMFIG